MTATKASDPRPESYRVDEASIRLLERDTLSDEAKVRLWQPFIAPSLKQLYADNRATNRSLGIFKPDPASIKFTVKPAKDADAADRAVAEQVRQMQQSSFLEDPLTPLEKPELAFGYRFTSAGHSHDPLIHDWEVQEAYRQYKHAREMIERGIAITGQTCQQSDSCSKRPPKSSAAELLVVARRWVANRYRPWLLSRDAHTLDSARTNVILHTSLGVFR